MKIRTIAALSCIGLAQSALANIDIQFDYSYDTSHFFTDSNAYRQNALNAAASAFESRLTDSLGTITSSSSDHFTAIFFNPADPNAPEVQLANQSVAANVIRVYVGSYDFSAGTLGIGGAGGFSCSGMGGFCTSARDRGQANTINPGATDVAPWGGAISFDTNTAWNFTMAAPAAGQYDLYSVAVHELGHVLGFGTSDSFANHLSGLTFSGAATGSVAMYDSGHWAENTTSKVNGMTQEAAMTPFIGDGQRKYFTDLDFAGLHDIGWQVSAVPEPEAWAMLLAGLGLIGWAARRRLR